MVPLTYQFCRRKKDCGTKEEDRRQNTEDWEQFVVESTADGAILDVRVIPRARKAGLAGTRENALLVRLTAPPVDGAANAQLIELLAQVFNIPKRRILISAGEQSRTKRVLLKNVDADTVASRLKQVR
jgi:uncharacterized protein (TIGR00251 family)